LPAQLEADSDLSHRGVSHVFAFDVHPACAVRAADAKAAFAEGGQHRITIVLAEKKGNAHLF